MEAFPPVYKRNRKPVLRTWGMSTGQCRGLLLSDLVPSDRLLTIDAVAVEKAK